MKAPDKIYVSHLIYDTWQYTTPNPDDETEVEYIRKDALLEWAKKEMGEWSSESNIAQGVKMGLTLVLDKIESL